MTDREWHSKEGKVVRKSPRRVVKNAYDVSQSTFKRLRQRGGEALPKQVPHNKGQCVLLDAKLASYIYSARCGKYKCSQHCTVMHIATYVW